MGRYKLGPQGAYYDPNDSGPDQASPSQIQAMQQSSGGPSAPNPSAPAGGDPYQQGARPGYHYEWSGGFTGGKHEVPDDPNNPNTPPLTGRDLLGPYAYDGDPNRRDYSPTNPMSIDPGFGHVQAPPAFDAFYAAQRAAGRAFPQILAAWRQQSGLAQGQPASAPSLSRGLLGGLQALGPKMFL